jgi:hypothetical protein
LYARSRSARAHTRSAVRAPFSRLSFPKRVPDRPVLGALRIEGVDDVFEAATRASMLMREGVPAHAREGGAQGGQHRRKNSNVGRTTEDEGAGKCCVVC